MRLIIILLFSLFILSKPVAAQDTTSQTPPKQMLFDSTSGVTLRDTTPVIPTDSVAAKKRHHDPHKATIRSAIIPGWGQAYNHEYWKIPIVYGALAIPVVTYLYNDKWYKKTKFAYEAVYDATIGDGVGNFDTSRLPLIDPKLRYDDTTFFKLETYQSYRNQFKKDKDYSVLYFIILWGVNVIDATVFGHLKEFDVSEDLTMKVSPSFDPRTKSKGIGLVFNFKNPTHKMLTVD